MDATELKNKAMEAVEFYTELGNEILKTTMPKPNVTFKVKGVVGGKYSTRNHEVMVNMVLFAENKEDYLEQTIPHEVAHAFQRHIYGAYRNMKRVMPHGNEWKHIMRALGKKPARCHSYDTSNASKRNVSRDYPYRCNCRTINLTAIRHRRFIQGVGYRCNLCKSSLVYAG